MQRKAKLDAILPDPRSPQVHRMQLAKLRCLTQMVVLQEKAAERVAEYQRQQQQDQQRTGVSPTSSRPTSPFAARGQVLPPTKGSKLATSRLRQRASLTQLPPPPDFSAAEEGYQCEQAAKIDKQHRLTVDRLRAYREMVCF
jgi:hypothetical protein